MKHINLAVSLLLLGGSAAYAGQPEVCKDAAVAQAPTSDQLEACLASEPVSLEVAGGYAIGGSASLFARGDKKLGPLWVSGRARYDYGGVTQLDALAGFVAWEKYGIGWDTWASAPSGGWQTVTSNKTVMRKAFVLTAGFKGVVVPGSDDPMSMAASGLTPVAVGGFQYHAVGGFKDHSIRELYTLYNLSSGKLGVIGNWHEAIPPLGPVVIGMELGLVPLEDTFDGYLTLEVGYALDL